MTVPPAERRIVLGRLAFDAQKGIQLCKEKPLRVWLKAVYQEPGLGDSVAWTMDARIAVCQMMDASAEYVRNRNFVPEENDCWWEVLFEVCCPLLILPDSGLGLKLQCQLQR